MTTATSIVVLGLCSAAGFAVSAAIPQSAGESLPWKDIAGGGAALLLLVALGLFLRFLSQDRAARDAERAADRVHANNVSSQFAATVEKANETHRLIHQDCHAAHRAREEALHELVKEHLRKAE